MTRVFLGMSCCTRSLYLREAIASMLAVRGVERCILRCDGSPDDVREIAIEFGDLYPDRLTVLLGDHLGQALSQNKIASLAKEADWLGFVDSDDVILPGAVEACLNAAAQYRGKQPLGCVYTQQRLMDTSGTVMGIDSRSAVPYSPENLLNGNHGLIVMHFRLLRLEAFQALEGFSDWDAAIDYEFFVRMSRSFEIVRVPQVHYYYRQHRDRISVRLRQQQYINAERAKRLGRQQQA